MTSPVHDAQVVHLRRGGTSVVARLAPDNLPCILHWGPDLGDHPPDQFQELIRALQMPGPHEPTYPHSWASVIPRQTAGWLGRPGLVGHRKGREWALTFTTVKHTGASGADAEVLRSVAADQTAGVETTTEIELLASGLVRLRAAVQNLHSEPYAVTLLEPVLPVPAEAGELLDMAGRPGHERTPQRRPFDEGQWVREAWGGRPGHDSATLLCAGRPGFGFRTGRVWGVHLAWSGNQTLSAEHSYTGWKLLRGGELIGPHEIVLGQGEAYASPWLYASWGEGLDELAGRFHDHLRARDTHPQRDRPVLVNTWEAVYFDQSLPKLIDLAERAADIGAERFVLDDGWFKGRRDDTTSLGDWVVDPGVYPDGLTPLVRAVQGLGMEFGLWFEPEMVNLDSELAREHPDWIMGTHAGPGLTSRNQHILDLANPEVWNHVYSRISALIDEHDIAYIKWDHNRPLTGAGHGPDHTPGVHKQTLAVYRMMQALRESHPGLEIESCCGGGGRLDLGIMEHASRAWLSDCIDAHERHRMARWTGLLLPPEMMGTHIGSGTDHTTGRRHTLPFRAGTAIWGHLGIEWDLTKITDSERAELRSWIAFYKRFRNLLHSGRIVHADNVNNALDLEGVIAPDGGEAVFRLSALGLPTRLPAGRIPLPGLEANTLYQITAVSPAKAAFTVTPPAWFDGGVSLPGRILDELGVMPPLLQPDDLVFLHAQAVR